MSRRRKKLYIIGMDSTPLWLLEELKRERGLEAFAEFFKEGTVTEMESTLPPITGPAWPSIYTGLPPAEHGVPDFFEIKSDYSQDIVFYDSKRHPPFWEILAEGGLRCLVVTPATDITPSESRNVDMITGFPTESRPNNKRMESAMQKHGFFGEPDVERDIKEGNITLSEASRRLCDTVRKRALLSMELIGAGDYDFVFICFTETDRIQHFTMGKPGYKSHLVPIYGEVAKLLGFVISRAREEGSAIMLVSDHGAQPIRNKFLINQFLAEAGYLDVGAAARKTIKGLGKGKYARFHQLDFDMGRTKAFAAISYDPVSTIWINDSRFENGTVGGAEKKRVKAALMRKLREAKSEEGDRIFVDVMDADEYYHGTNKFIAPDIFVEAKIGYTVDIFNFSRSAPFMKPEAPKMGDHIRRGIFGVYPRELPVDTDDFNVVNVAPTALSFYGRLRSGKAAANSRYPMHGRPRRDRAVV